MTVTYHKVEQGTDEWYAARLGLLTASEMKYIITEKKLQYAQNDKEKSHFYELLAQRVNQYVEPTFTTFAMERGNLEELDAKLAYNQHVAPIDDVGFITNDKWGFTIGFSPDAMVRGGGQIECKSRCQKYQIETILADAMPDEFLIQVQTGLLVSEQPWCDFISYCGGMPMFIKRVEADKRVQDAIVAAAEQFYSKMDAMMALYHARITAPDRIFIPTERKIEEEISSS